MRVVADGSAGPAPPRSLRNIVVLPRSSAIGSGRLTEMLRPLDCLPRELKGTIGQVVSSTPSDVRVTTMVDSWGGNDAAAAICRRTRAWRRLHPLATRAGPWTMAEARSLSG